MNHRESVSKPTSCLQPISVTSPEQMEMLLNALAAETLIAVDTESNSLYAYQERVCLIQFSTMTADFLVDPLVGLDLTPLGEIFASSRVTKVFHAAEYDIMCLKRDFGFEFSGLFDTMWAARILGWSKVGLGSILSKEFGVDTNKRYQRYNWGKRPLEPEALAYACLDTHYLRRLQSIQSEALVDTGHWEEAQEVFAEVAASEAASAATPNLQGFWRIKHLSALTSGELAILSALYLWREREAQRRDRPPFKILSKNTLVKLAQARPRTMEELKRAAPLKPYHLRKYGQPVLQAIRQGKNGRLPVPPSSPRRSKKETMRYEALRAWRKIAAAKRGVDPDVILGNAALWQLAELNPQTIGEWDRISEIGAWKRSAYGETVLRVLRTMS